MNDAENSPPQSAATPVRAFARTNPTTADFGAELKLMLRWMDTHPEVPDGKWFKRFPEMGVCGEGELIKTFLVPGQVQTGEEIE